MIRLALIAAALLAFVAPHDAYAQGFINPFVGTTISSPTATGSSTKAGYGVAFGGMGKIVGGETEFAYYPAVIDNSANAIAKNRVLSFTAGMLIGPTIGRAKPYFSVGTGDLHLNVTGLSNLVVPNAASISNDYFGFYAGGGVMGFFTNHLGVRGDLRYSRAFGIKTEDLQTAGLALAFISGAPASASRRGSKGADKTVVRDDHSSSRTIVSESLASREHLSRRAPRARWHQLRDRPRGRQ